jgi:subtilisin family serine protease
MKKLIGLFVFLVFLICLSTCSHPSDKAWYLDKMNLDSAWNIAQGEGVVIAFIDSGISMELYQSCGARMVAPYNMQEGSTDVTDKNGHGTAMISLVCGYDDIQGIAPRASIMPVEVVDVAGRSTPLALAQGIYWAVDHGADVLCLPLGSHVHSQDVEQSISYATTKGAIVVAAAGDYDERDLLFPACLGGVVAVASIDSSGDLCDFSNYADGCMLIPGEDIYTMTLDGSTESNYGTSVSCSILSGIIALGLEIDPDASFDLISDSLNESYHGKFIDVEKFLKNLEGR